jgi:Tol biopolymer transport system component
LPGIGYAPAWSAGGRWLAVEVSNPPPAGQPYLRPPATLWLVNAAGTSARRLTPASWQIGGFAWAPHRDELAVAAYLPHAPLARSYLAATVTPAGQSRILTASETLTGPAWSSDGTRLAVGTGSFSAGQWYSRLDVLSLTGGPSAVAVTTTGNVLELAGWWPDGQGLLYWPDYQGSASIAADGLPLDSVALGSRSPRTLVQAMLVHGSWLAPSPAGHAFAAVSGGDRVIWSGGKQITLCAATGRCTPVPQPSGLVSVDPSWSPGGTAIAFARLSASGHADFTPSSITRWEATSRLWTVSANGSQARPLTAAGPGALDPVWGRDGTLLFVRADSLWLLPPGATAPTRLTTSLGALSGTAFYRTYYGYVPYSQLFAWTLAPQPTVSAPA